VALPLRGDVAHAGAHLSEAGESVASAPQLSLLASQPEWAAFLVVLDNLLKVQGADQGRATDTRGVPDGDEVSGNSRSRHATPF
jgi:hypothetical protein